MRVFRNYARATGHFPRLLFNSRGAPNHHYIIRLSSLCNILFLISGRSNGWNNHAVGSDVFRPRHSNVTRIPHCFATNDNYMGASPVMPVVGTRRQESGKTLFKLPLPFREKECSNTFPFEKTAGIGGTFQTRFGFAVFPPLPVFWLSAASGTILYVSLFFYALPVPEALAPFRCRKSIIIRKPRLH